MEQLEKFITDHKFPIGEWSEAIIEWLTDNYEWVFDFISDVLQGGIDGTVDLLVAVPPLLLLLIGVAIYMLVP